MRVFLLFTCDNWKTSESMRLRGMFSDEEKLRHACLTLIQNEVIEYPEGWFSSPDEILEWPLADITNHINQFYIHWGADGDFEPDGGFLI